MDPSRQLVSDPSAAGRDLGAEATESSDGAPEAGLADRDVRILDFERQWWRHAGSKEQAIQETFGISPTRYYQLLNKLLDSPEALAYDPTLIKRLRRLRASRVRARSPQPQRRSPQA